MSLSCIDLLSESVIGKPGAVKLHKPQVFSYEAFCGGIFKTLYITCHITTQSYFKTNTINY